MGQQRLAVFSDFQLGGGADVRNVEQLRQRRPELPAVQVDLLLAAQDQVVALVFDSGGDQAGHLQFVEVVEGLILQVDALVAADGQGRPQRLGRLRRSDDQRGDAFDVGAFLLELHRLLDGELVEGVDHHLDSSPLDILPIRADLDGGG